MGESSSAGVAEMVWNSKEVVGLLAVLAAHLVQDLGRNANHTFLRIHCGTFCF